MFRSAALLESRADEATDLICREVGKTRAESAGEVQRGVDILRYFGGLASSATGEMLPSRARNSFIYTSRHPVGPTAVITPWNFPLAIPLWKIAPALIYGNTVVFKPAEQSSAVAWIVASVLLDGGLPDGVFNVTFGDGALIGAALLAHPDLRAITFTGSTSVGRQIEIAATARGIKVQLELGGNNATLVLDDADVDEAADLVTGAAMKLAGQKCTATSRVIATLGIANALRDAIVDRVKALRVGDPSLSDDVDVGPVIDGAARRDVVRAMDAARQDGARVLVGGTALTGDGFDDGYFVAPTVLEQVASDSALGQEEVFGPVLAFMRAHDLDGAIRTANGVRYGLSAAVITNNLTSALRCARDLDTGVVKVNSESSGLEPHVPFGGVKESGSHFREQGTAAREFFTKMKTVYVQPSRSAS
jgi:aldehyde dehydrogenase (NAD+)